VKPPSDGLIEARACTQSQTFSAGLAFARTEGYVPAPETNRAIACVIQEARKAKEEGRQKVILMNWSGHGLIDLGAYGAFLKGRLEHVVLGDDEIGRLMKDLEKFPKP
jgi:tryptophan synthase beta chain